MIPNLHKFASFYIWLHLVTSGYTPFHPFTSFFDPFLNPLTWLQPILSNSKVEKALNLVESRTGRKFGDSINPLLVSVRSGARASMPGEWGQKKDENGLKPKVLESRKPVWLAISTAGSRLTSRLENHPLSVFRMPVALSQEWWTQFWTWDWTTSRWRLWQRSQATVALPLTATDALSRCILTLSSALRSTTLRSIWSVRKRSVAWSRRIYIKM